MVPVKRPIRSRVAFIIATPKSVKARINSTKAVTNPKISKIHLSSCIRSTPFGVSLSNMYFTL